MRDRLIGILCHEMKEMYILFFQMQRSNGNTMVLDRVDFINSGAYSCEVIADQTFHTLIETKHMLVIGK